MPDLQNQMNSIQNHGTSGGERADAVDHCLSAIARLSTEAQDASSYIPAYDQRTYGDAIKALNSRLQEVRFSVAPKPKFAFKTGGLFSAKKNESAISINDAAELAGERRNQMIQAGSSNVSSFATTPIEVASPANERIEPVKGPTSASNTFVNAKDHEHIILSPTVSLDSATGTVTNIKDSVINLSSCFLAGLTLKNISKSLILCGHVSGAIHLTNVKNSIVVVASRQFRMHDSSDCSVYLLTTSRPIIEDCTGIHFAPLPDGFMVAEDGQVENMWENVDDFKWLRNEQSPNWDILKAEQRVSGEVWEKVTSGGEHVGTDEVLNAVGVSASSPR